VDEAARAVEHGVQDSLRRRHLPKDVHVDAALAARGLVRHARLGDRAVDREGDQLLVALTARLAVVVHGNDVAVAIARVGVDARERADPARRGPRARAFAVRHRNALAALDEGQDFTPGHQQRFQSLQGARSWLGGETVGDYMGRLP
jgi:hypothetical protein